MIFQTAPDVTKPEMTYHQFPSLTDTIRERIYTANASFAASDNISAFIMHDEMKELEDELTVAFGGVLQKLVIDPNDPNSADTPRRLAKMYLYEVFAGRYEKRPDTTAFPNDG